MTQKATRSLQGPDFGLTIFTFQSCLAKSGPLPFQKNQAQLLFSLKPTLNMRVIR